MSKPLVQIFIFTTAIAIGQFNPVAGQDSSKQSGKSTAVEPDQRQLMNRIIDVLNSTANEASRWDDKAVAARTQAQIADLIWDTNQENTTVYLQLAWDAA